MALTDEKKRKYKAFALPASDRLIDPAGPEEIIRKKQEFLMPCSYHFYKYPPQIVKGKGTVLTDSTGKEYIDFFAGVSVMSCGHCNEEINERAIEQIRTLQHTTSIYLTEPVVKLAEKLAGVLPGDIAKSFFCNSGSEANEGALLLARTYTGRREFIAMKGSLHGRTYLTAGVTEIPMWRGAPHLDEVPVTFVSNAEELASLLKERGEDFAAFIVEPLQGNGGIIPLPDDFFENAGPLLREKGVLLISDEVQSGFARTGKMFAIEHYRCPADIITGAKALGNGFPIGFFAATPEIASCFTKPSASTLGGNPVSSAAALAVLDFIEKHTLVENSQELGQYLIEEFAVLQKDVPFFAPPRGLGLMVGIEVLDWEGQEAPELVDRILEEMKERGFLIGKNGLNRNVLAFQPPLVITYREISDMVTALRVTVEGIIEGVKG